MGKQMTSKERMRAAVNHQEGDRVPISWAYANEDILRRLNEHFGVSDEEGLLQALHVDTRNIWLQYVGPKIHDEVEDRRVDPLWGIRTRWIENEAGGYWDFCDFPLKDATLEEVEAWPMPNPDDFDYDGFVAECDRHAEQYIIYGNPGVGDIINSTGMLRTMEQVLMDLALEDPAGLRIFDRKCATELEILKRVLAAAKGKVDMVWIGEDLGTQNSPILSLDMYRKVLKPLHKRFVDAAKEYDLPVMIHSCGSSSWAFEDFIEIGINVADTLQPEAKDMAPAYLKETYGDRLAFHGCISTAGPMAYGTLDETVQYVKDTLEVMKPGGGYIFAPTHMIQDNSPTENVLAAYEAVLKYGAY